jgi:hypothetical protein
MEREKILVLPHAMVRMSAVDPDATSAFDGKIQMHAKEDDDSKTAITAAAALPVSFTVTLRKKTLHIEVIYKNHGRIVLHLFPIDGQAGERSFTVPAMTCPCRPLTCSLPRGQEWKLFITPGTYVRPLRFIFSN